MEHPTRHSRRSFLRSALFLVGGLFALSLPVGCQRVSYPAVGRSLRFFTPKEWTVLDGVVDRLIPSAKSLSVDVPSAADALLSQANATLQADVRRLLGTFEDWTWLSLRFKPFTAMSPSAQDGYLRAWMDSPLGLQRQGFAALNKLAHMLFYMDARSWPSIRFPGPWVGRFDAGYGLDNQGDLAANPNPNVFRMAP